MAVKEIFRFSCDAPGCEKKIEIEAEHNEQVEVPDGWFDEHVFEIAIRASRLPDHLRDALSLEPIVLPAWDPMGALA